MPVVMPVTARDPPKTAPRQPRRERKAPQQISDLPRGRSAPEGLEVRCSIQLSCRRVLECSRVTARASSEDGPAPTREGAPGTGLPRTLFLLSPGAAVAREAEQRRGQRREFCRDDEF